jgi:predicted Zn-dependent peptidase
MERPVSQMLFQHTLANGMVLIAERMEHVRSAAFNFLLPGGSAYDPPEQRGIGSLLAEMIVRGAGSRNHRELSAVLDSLGTDRSESAGRIALHLGCSMLARHLPAVLGVYADILRRPHLPPEELPAVQALALQDLDSLEDNPSSQVRIELHHCHFPSPLNQDSYGTAEGIRAVTPQSLRNHYERCVKPNGIILAVAGDIQWEPLRDTVERLFGDWPAGPLPELSIGSHTPCSRHLFKDTHQTHIAFAYPSVPVNHPQYYAARAAEAVLCGGMSSRLFTEVREKRGLCYSISLTHKTFRHLAAVVGYAGTGADRAQQTLEVTLSELRRLAEGVEADEVDRIRAGLKSGLIMQQESTKSRAGTMASDWFFLGRVRTYDEMQQIIDQLTPDMILEHVRAFPCEPVTVATLGPHPLALPPYCHPYQPSSGPAAS